MRASDVVMAILKVFLEVFLGNQEEAFACGFGDHIAFVIAGMLTF